MPIETIGRRPPSPYMDQPAEHNDEYMDRVLIRGQILSGSHLLGAERGEKKKNKTAD